MHIVNISGSKRCIEMKHALVIKQYNCEKYITLYLVVFAKHTDRQTDKNYKYNIVGFCWPYEDPSYVYFCNISYVQTYAHFSNILV